jgi:multidrug efflux pump subunit AcrA (membrane-fusion protein)
MLTLNPKEVTMKTILTCAVAAVFAIASFAAQDKPTAAKQSKEVQHETKTMTADKTAKTSTDTVYGKVESYEPGKSIKVTVPGKIVSSKSFDLDSKDATVNVAPNVKAGEWVSVVEKTDSNGHKTVTVKPSAQKAHAKKTQ